jgi:glycosyltransferase involved in cell wall biosynthesis
MSLVKSIKGIAKLPRAVSSRRFRKRIGQLKEERLAASWSYRDHPNCSAALLSFNHRANAKTIVERLRRTDMEEIVICEDGSSDGSLEEWVRLLTRPNELVLRSNDLHEIRAYDRGIRVARGEIVAAMQDDDIPPLDPAWFSTAMTLFERYPKLDILGGYCGFTAVNAPATQELREEKNWSPRFQTEDGIPFMFVMAVNSGPIFFRRERYLEIGGFDLGYSKPHWTGIHYDKEICLRALVNGGQVGLFDCPFERRVGGQGTLVFGHSEKRVQQDIANTKRLKDQYGSRFPELEKQVQELNEGLVPLEPDLAKMPRRLR